MALTLDYLPASLTGLRTINLRQNLLTDVSAWSACSSKGVIEDIEFRDNQLKEVRAYLLALIPETDCVPMQPFGFDIPPSPRSNGVDAPPL